MAKKLGKWEQVDKLRMSNALAEIGDSANLRFLFRNLLELTTTDTQLPSDPGITAFNAGVLHVNRELRSYLSQSGIELLHQIELEEQHEILERLSNPDAPVERDDRGSSERSDDGDDNRLQYDTND